MFIAVVNNDNFTITLKDVVLVLRWWLVNYCRFVYTNLTRPFTVKKVVFSMLQESVSNADYNFKTRVSGN